MKKLIAIVSLLTAMFTITPTTCAAQPLDYDTLDTLTMVSSVVVSTSYDECQEEWLIQSRDCNGHIWAWYADDASWEVGDGVNLLLQDINDTPMYIYDDAVVMVHYERYDLL